MSSSNNSNPGYVNIFISHKSDDADAALHLKEQFEVLGGNRVVVFVSEDITPGADWKEWIEESIGESNVLVLLFTRSTATWDWCLYETGIFNALNKGAVIVIHGEGDEPPSPLKHIQAIEATPDKVAAFLKNLFGKSTIKGINPPAINPKLASNKRRLKEEATKICDFFSGHKELSRSYTKKMVLKIKQQGKGKLKEIPPDSPVIADQDTLSMFGLSKRIDKGHWTWGDLTEHVDNESWMSSLQTAILKAHNSETFDNILTTLQTPQGEVFRPVLHRLERDPEGTRHFDVFFIEQITEGASINAPQDIATLLTSLTLASRLQWEICDNYIYQVPNWTDADLANNLITLKATFDNIHREGDFRKQLEFPRPGMRDRLVWAFDTIQDQNYVEDNLANQRSWKVKLMQGIENKDRSEVILCLKKLQVLNVELAAKVAKRYEERLRKVPLAKTDASQ